MAIEKSVLLKGGVMEVRNLEISSTTIEDNSYGHGFIVRGYHAYDWSMIDDCDISVLKIYTTIQFYIVTVIGIIF